MEHNCVYSNCKCIVSGTPPSPSVKDILVMSRVVNSLPWCIWMVPWHSMNRMASPMNVSFRRMLTLSHPPPPTFCLLPSSILNARIVFVEYLPHGIWNVLRRLDSIHFNSIRFLIFFCCIYIHLVCSYQDLCQWSINQQGHASFRSVWSVCLGEGVLDMNVVQVKR